MRVRFYALALVAVLATATMTDGCFDSAMPSMQDRSEDLAKSANYVTAAAGESDIHINDLKVSIHLRDRALDPANVSKGDAMSFSDIDGAIKRTPTEATLYSDRAAMEVALGKDSAAVRDGAHARGLYQRFYKRTPDLPDLAPDSRADYEFTRAYVKSLGNVWKSLPLGSAQRERIRAEVCAQYASPPQYASKLDGQILQLPPLGGIVCW